MIELKNMSLSSCMKKPILGLFIFEQMDLKALHDLA